ncbi:MAG: YibE/F family protein [Peptococcaceae bacterium]|nr:YibE/F family protein [Peptococcaceae bacterium]
MIIPTAPGQWARVLEVNNDNVFSTIGFVFQGEQVCKVEILDGPFKGRQTDAANRFAGRLEWDKVFVTGDKALVVIDYTGQTIRHVTMIDHYRINLEAYLFGIFALFLVLFAGWTGAKALLSFLLTVLMIWKLLIPMLLKGWNPIIIALFFVIIATTLILFMVGGLNRKSVAAVLGSGSVPAPGPGCTASGRNWVLFRGVECYFTRILSKWRRREAKPSRYPQISIDWSGI